MNLLCLRFRLALAFGATGLLLACPGSKRSLDTRREPLALQSALAAPSDAGFLRAYEPKLFRFPEDHAPHPGFRTEWWYVTGNLKGNRGERYGFQLTFFRHQLVPEPISRPASLATHEIWMVHAALSSEAEKRFRFAERLARSNQVRIDRDPFGILLGPFSLQSTDPFAETFAITARTPEFGFSFELGPGRGPILQGEAGLSRKGSEPGNASYYYSFTRLPTRGELEVGGRRIPVTGLAWLDREWSTSVLPAEVVGWDWMALHLLDGSDLMLYRLRRADGSSTPESNGSWIQPDGSVLKLTAEEFILEPRGRVRTASGTLYPSRFAVKLPKWEMEFEVVPLLPDQELQTTIRYWEGAVEVQDRVSSRQVRGSGYLEMTGYAERKSGIRSSFQPGKSFAFGSTPK